MGAQQKPSWEAYQERLQRQQRQERLRALADRYGFPLAVGVLVLGLLGALVLFSSPVAPEEKLDAEALAALAAVHEAKEAARETATPAATTTLSVQTEPAGAVVLLDQSPVGVTPLDRRALPAGVYALSVQSEGYAPLDTIVVLRGDEPADFALALRRQTAYAEPARTSEPPRHVPTPSEAPANFQTRLAQAAERAEAESASAPPPGVIRLAATDVAPDVAEPPPAAVEAPEPLQATQGEGETSGSALDVAQAGPDVAGQAGMLKVLVKPWGSIYINGELHRREADVRYAVPLAPDAYRVTAVHPTLGTWERTIHVAAGAEASVVVDFNRPTSAAPASAAADGGGAEPDLENR